MFGHNLLVMPVTDSLYTYYDRKARKGFTKFNDIPSASEKVEVYLPKGTDWYDFWNNEKHSGGRIIQRECPIDIMPVYVKAGSIVPFGPAVQYVAEKKWNNLEIRIYPGADADFTLYEDEGDNYNYEKGAFTEIKFHWDDSNKTLTVADREGSYNGMLKNRKFRILLVDSNAPSGDLEPKKFSKVISYNGKKKVVNF